MTGRMSVKLYSYAELSDRADAERAFRTGAVGCVVKCSTSLPFVGTTTDEAGETKAEGFTSAQCVFLQINIDEHSSHADQAAVLDETIIDVVVAMHMAEEQGHGVLVYCMDGRQIAPTVSAAFLMYRFGLSVDAALQCVCQTRPESFTDASGNRLALFKPMLQNLQADLEKMAQCAMVDVKS